MSTNNGREATNRRILKWFGIVAGALVALVVVSFIVDAAGGDNDSGSNTSASEKSDSDGTTTPASDDKKKKTSPRDELFDAIEDIDDDAEVKMAGGDLTVTYPLDNNISTGMMADVGKKTTLDIIGAVQDSDVKVPVLQVNATAEMVDKYGEESEDVAVTATYSKGVVDKIQTDTVSVDDIWDLADIETFVHPEFQ